jgi:hypothetical protein
VVPEVIRQIREIEGTWISGNVITGFPFETVEAIERTLEYATSLDLDWLYVYRFIPFPGIPTYKDCVEKGLVERPTSPGQQPKMIVTRISPTLLRMAKDPTNDKNTIMGTMKALGARTVIAKYRAKRSPIRKKATWATRWGNSTSGTTSPPPPRRATKS